jgi:hypothetical protein
MPSLMPPSGAVRRAAVLLAVVLGGCGAEPPAEWMTDTGVPFVDYGLIWMDDDRLLFQRMERGPAPPDPTNPWAGFTFPLSIWSAAGGLESLSGDEAVSDVCYAPRTGALSYRVFLDDENRTVLRVGTPAGVADVDARPRPARPTPCATRSPAPCSRGRRGLQVMRSCRWPPATGSSIWAGRDGPIPDAC